MNKYPGLKSSALILFAGLVTPAAAQTDTPKSPAAETAPQTSATTTVKSPAGVTDPNSAQSDQTGINGAKTGCKSASAEMTNGATESCKQ